MFSNTCKAVMRKNMFNTTFAKENDFIETKSYSIDKQNALPKSINKITDCEKIITQLAIKGYDLIDQMQDIVDKLEKSIAQLDTIGQCQGTLTRKIQAALDAVTKAKESGMMPTQEALQDVIHYCDRLNQQVQAFNDFLDEFRNDLRKQEKNHADANIRATERLYVLNGDVNSISSVSKDSPNNSEDDNSVKLQRSNFRR